MTGDYATLVASRICHDLISPLGAISNGVELIGMTQHLGGAEMALINDSVANANARVRFFRIVFGEATPDQMIRASEVQSILADYSDSGRVGFVWRVPDAQRRIDVRTALLVLLCFETALPRGGKVTVDRDAAGWTFAASGEQIRWSVDLWDGLTDPLKAAPPTPADVQFALLASAVRSEGTALTVTRLGNDITVTIR